jgi:repressor LexA
MQGLTQRQQMVLDFIRQSIQDRGYPPTLREIGARMGIRSTNGVNDHLRALERKGYLTREDMKSRALRPTSLGTHPLGNAGVSSEAAANDVDFVEVPILDAWPPVSPCSRKSTSSTRSTSTGTS